MFIFTCLVNSLYSNEEINIERERPHYPPSDFFVDRRLKVINVSLSLDSQELLRLIHLLNKP